MDRDDIIKMAKEAGLYSGSPRSPSTGRMIEKRLKRFAELVAAAEREACAKVVDDYCGAWDDEGYALAAAIRARGQK